MTPQLPGNAAPRPARMGNWAGFLAAALFIATALWMGLGWDFAKQKGNWSGRKNDYYNLLAHGFLKGHLYLDMTPDPRLESNVPAERHVADYLLDASYLRKHYYLYFGATPVVAFLVPYDYVTGGDLDARFVAVFCVCTGFLAAFATWRMFMRDHAARAGPWTQFFSVLVLAFATATPLLLTRSMFYEVAIATGYACVMAAAFFICRALTRRGCTWLNLALASLFMGLSVGCRPDLLLGFPALAMAAFLAARDGTPCEPLTRRMVRMGTAAVVPAAAVGSCIAVYNFERFGSPLDFGFMYCMNPFFDVSRPMAKASFFWTNVRWDFLTPPSLSPYFPFALPESASFRPPFYAGDEAIHGQFVVFAVVLFVAVTVILMRRRLFAGGAGRFLGVVSLMFLGPFTGLCFLCLRADRYVVDFETPLALLTATAAVLAASRLQPGLGKGLWVTALGVLAVVMASFNFFAGLEEFDVFKDVRIDAYKNMESLCNVPSAWLVSHGLLPVGPVEIRVVFPQNLKTARIEPLVSSGTPDKSDSLYVIEHEDNVIEFMGDHHGYGGHRSKFYTIVPGREYTLTIDMGAFYPPLNHPFFSDYTLMQAHLLKTRLQVKMDGADVMSDKMNSYDAPPWSVEAGRNDLTLTPFHTEFTGRILSQKRLSPAAPSAVHLNNGLWRIRCVVPTEMPNMRYPLLSVGLAGSGTMFYMVTYPDNRIGFGMDEWGIGGQTSAVYAVTPGVEHEIDIFVGPLAQITQWPKEWGLAPARLTDSRSAMRVWMDGKVMWSSLVHRDFDPTDSFVDVGSNLQGFSTAEPDFYGQIRSDPFSEAESREFLERNLKEGVPPIP